MYNYLISPTSYKAGIYIRLPEKASDKKYESDSESIINQRNILTSYLKDNNYILTEEYIDDEYSETNLDRPEFHKLIENILV